IGVARSRPRMSESRSTESSQNPRARPPTCSHGHMNRKPAQQCDRPERFAECHKNPTGMIIVKRYMLRRQGGGPLAALRIARNGTVNNEALPVQAMVLVHPKEVPLWLTGTVSKICWHFYT